MQDLYLNARLQSYAHPQELPENTDEVIIITSEEELRSYNIPLSLTGSLLQAFEEKKNLIRILWENHRRFLVMLAKTELEAIRLAGASLYAILKQETSSTVHISGLDKLTEKARYAMLEGLILSSYHFHKYKTKKNPLVIQVYIPQDHLAFAQLEELTNLGQIIAHVKTIVNEPVNHLNAIQFSEIAIETGKQYGFETEVYHKEKITALGMGGVLAVNSGSDTPPTFNIFRYQPAHARNSKPLVLVGKGVMYDTGGYSLKTGGFMSNMKSDMAGGAAVLGIMAAIAASKLPYYVIGLVPATDNKISSNAMVVDDVITMLDGTTVEIQNTDAEGRLVLADALAFAKQYDPELVIDIATLTGASTAITATFGSSVLGNNLEAIQELSAIGEEVYERLIHLPLWPEYGDLLKSEIADIKNIGGPAGGVSSAGKFLEHFTDYPWVHLDIAGAAFAKEAKGYRQYGATAVPLRLIYQFIKKKSSGA